MSIAFQGTRQELLEQIYHLVSILEGQAEDLYGIHDHFFSALGLAALKDISDAYKAKARGEADEMGIRWRELNPATIRARRHGRPTPEQQELFDNFDKRAKARKQEYKREALDRLSLRGIQGSHAEGVAEKSSEAKIKAEKDKLEMMASRSVEILVDTSRLFNSLSPGRISQGEYQKPQKRGGEKQKFEIKEGEVIVGTNVIYAATHNYGSKKRGIPRRQFLPESGEQVPDKWWQNWLEAGREALIEGFKEYIETA